MLSKYDKIEDVPAAVLQEAKRLGFSDFQIARFVEDPDGNIEKESLRVRAVRKKNNVLPSVKRINTVASENPELTNYLYVTYDGTGATRFLISRMKNRSSCSVRALTGSAVRSSSTGAR